MLGPPEAAWGGRAEVPGGPGLQMLGTKPELYERPLRPRQALPDQSYRQGHSGSATENFPVTPSKSPHLSGSQLPSL